jgi:hypothetical protein
MAKQEKTVYKKRMGRPPGVVYTETVLVRLTKDAVLLIEEWSRQQDPPVTTRSQAIRCLVALGLAAPRRAKKSKDR